MKQDYPTPLYLLLVSDPPWPPRLESNSVMEEPLRGKHFKRTVSECTAFICTRQLASVSRLKQPQLEKDLGWIYSEWQLFQTKWPSWDSWRGLRPIADYRRKQEYLSSFHPTQTGWFLSYLPLLLNKSISYFHIFVCDPLSSFRVSCQSGDRLFTTTWVTCQWLHDWLQGQPFQH